MLCNTSCIVHCACVSPSCIVDCTVHMSHQGEHCTVHMTHQGEVYCVSHSAYMSHQGEEGGGMRPPGGPLVTQALLQLSHPTLHLIFFPE